ncbi:carboxylesterase 1-like [Euphorbia lathyris]|uniref:carboxylesterase 1-like n=1 Tax=Euphorbia lathyris TaxID=212925 RepID=UPI003313CA99
MEENQSIPMNSSVPDLRKLIVLNPDGTYTRLLHYPTVPADSSSSLLPVLTKDIQINSTKKTWLRIYLPRHLLHSSSNRLPLIVYYHGGSFIFFAADSTFHHDFCIIMSQRIDAVIVSIEYRRAPEHRLPAAYDDAFEALEFIKSSQEDWLTQFTDLSRCFLMGTSAGGNIAYHTGLRVCRSGRELEPLKIQGLVLHHPFFGGLERTGSELRLVNDSSLPLDGNDFMWELSLPVGYDRDHEYCNPMTASSSSSKFIREAGLRVLVLGAYGDPLIDRLVEFAKMLEENGVMMVAHFGEGSHGVELFDSLKAELLFSILKDFFTKMQLNKDNFGSDAINKKRETYHLIKK